MNKLARIVFSQGLHAIKDSRVARMLAGHSLGIHSNRIEINGACNAKCTFCHTGRVRYSKTRHMPPELFEQILTHLKEQGLLTRHVWLYDRGEPFLHPEIGTFLDICQRFGVKARISSTATKVPKLTKSQWRTISMFKLSMSGITQSSYGKIHGLNIKTIKKNAETISKLLPPVCYAQLSWHRYQFNLDEEPEARRWAKSLGFVFDAIDAEVIEIEKLVSLAEKTTDKQTMDEIESMLLVDRSKLLTRLTRSQVDSTANADKKDFICSQFDQVAINYDGELLKCCSLSPDYEENRLGSMLSLSRDEIKQRNYAPCNICAKCIRYDIAPASNPENARIWNGV